jgi:hypothetical protein
MAVWQVEPVKPVMQVQVPSGLTTPRSLHWEALLNEQFVPLKPASQVQLPAGLHVPWPEHVMARSQKVHAA